MTWLRGSLLAVLVIRVQFTPDPKGGTQFAVRLLSPG